MKLLAGIVVIGGLGAVGISYLINAAAESAEGAYIGFACGQNLDEEDVVDVVVRTGMTMSDPPRLMENGQIEPWSKWIPRHFKLRDSAGQSIEFKRSNFSETIKDFKGTPEFYLTALIQRGMTYTMDYLPLGETPDGNTYRHEFTMIEESLPYHRVFIKAETAEE